MKGMESMSKLSESTVRRRLRKLGYELVSPWAYDRRNIGPIGSGYVLIPHRSGMSFDEVDAILNRLESGAVVWSSPSSGMAH